MGLSQEGWPNPQEFKDREELMLRYTQKMGEVDAIKKLVAFLEGQKEVIENITKKYETKEEYKI